MQGHVYKGTNVSVIGVKKYAHLTSSEQAVHSGGESDEHGDGVGCSGRGREQRARLIKQAELVSVRHVGAKPLALLS